MSPWPRLLITIVCALVSGCAQGDRKQERPANHRFVVASTNTGLGLWRYNYVGKWQLVYGMHDGRWRGSSARSFRTGNSVGFAFDGNRVRVYGVLGPGGGYGNLAIDNTVKNARLNFYSPHKRTHALVYESPVLPKGYHALAIVVTGTRADPAGGTFVNLEAIEVQTNATTQEVSATQH
ncbi:MAG: hypothetical protein ACXWNK_09485 [Vulcanimicrobiaceae bacterium]